MFRSSTGFKIVQKIMPNNKRTLSVVPSSWHMRLSNVESVVMWPTFLGNRGSLQRNADSKPGTISEGWEMFPCNLKGCGFKTFEEAVDQVRKLARVDAVNSVATENYPKREKKYVRQRREITRRDTYNCAVNTSTTTESFTNREKTTDPMCTPNENVPNTDNCEVTTNTTTDISYQIRDEETEILKDNEETNVDVKPVIFNIIIHI